MRAGWEFSKTGPLLRQIMVNRKIIKLILLAAVFNLARFIFVPVMAHAQEPEELWQSTCPSGTIAWHPGGLYSSLLNEMFDSNLSTYWQSGGTSGGFQFAGDTPVRRLVFWGTNNDNNRIVSIQDVNNGFAQIYGTLTFNVSNTPTSNDYVYVDFEGDFTNFRVNMERNTPNVYLFEMVACVDGEPEPPISGGDDCVLVDDANFTGVITDAWLLDGNAVITNSVLTLSPGDAAAQNLSTITENISYSAIISVATTTVQTILDVGLGNITNTVEITGAGRFTVELGSINNIAGPVLYSLQNLGPGELNIDYTCLSTGEGRICLAPENGSFDTDTDWQWYRNAYWEQFSQMAALPFNSPGDLEASLIQSSRVYSMPEVSAGQYLILAYQVQAADEVGLISSKVGTNESEQNVYKAPYDYEVDISNQAGESVEISFADSGTSDLLLDNVCVFMSTEPPQLPQPTDPDGIIGIDFGFNYTCRDVPALLAGFAINVYGLQATYEAGVSVWEPQYYIPWLAAALWTNAGQPVSCFIVEEMRLIAGVTQQQINEFLNFANWTVRSTNTAAPWLQSGFTYLKNASFSPATAARATAAGWLPWWANNTRNLLTSFGANWEITIDWIREAAIYISDASLGSDLQEDFPNVGSGWGMLDLVWAFVDLVWWLWAWIFNNVIMMAGVPLEFWAAFNDGIASEPFASLISCGNYNFWCLFLSGVQLVNQTVSDTILYPAVIILSVVCTFMILWDDFWKMVSIDIR